MLKHPYNKAYGIWQVTTEGDCEGRTTRHLGTFEGYVDEIALYLADKCYSLMFRPVVIPTELHPTKNEVSVYFDIDSGTWDMSNQKRAIEFGQLLKDRPVEVEEGQYFASVKIRIKETPEQKQKREYGIALAKAKKALTAEDFRILGLDEF